MDQQEAFRLLGRASAVDNRKVTQLAAIVWSDTLPDMSYDEAADLMNEFRRDNPGVYLEPGHLQRQKRIRLARTRKRVDRTRCRRQGSGGRSTRSRTTPSTPHRAGCSRRAMTTRG
ncbi:hypothetical protein QP157_06830 [Sphingomonas sp. LR61]|uniref:hypothetical protein n=1 Tax=Sphingomonas sp. LR61 TaxID=3050234 RepID=UPI002FDF14FD